MPRLYFLHSARLGFSQWKSDDFSLALGLWGDERVTRLIGGPFSEEQVRQRLALEIANQAAHGIQFCIKRHVFYRKDHRLLVLVGVR